MLFHIVKRQGSRSDPTGFSLYAKRDEVQARPQRGKGMLFPFCPSAR